MTRLEFYAACADRLIDPSLACENEAIAKALLESPHNDEKILNLLDTEF